MNGVLVALGAGIGVFAVLAGGVPSGLARGRARARRLAMRSLGVTARAAWEETVWRWLLLGRLAQLLGPLPALGVSSVAFGISHRTSQGWRGAGANVVTGAAFGGVYLLTGSLVAATAAHAVYNVLVALAVELAP